MSKLEESVNEILGIETKPETSTEQVLNQKFEPPVVRKEGDRCSP